MKAFAYLRVSGLGQVSGDGFDRQLEAVDKYAAANGYEITEVFREEGVSGTKEMDDRPALAELLVALEENGIKTVIIEKLDRLARDLMVQETIIGDLQKRGFILISAHEPDLCSEDPSRRLMRQIMGAIAEYDRAMIVLKLRAARQRIKARTGRCEGRKPFGEWPDEAATLALIMRWSAAGHHHKRIADDLNRANISTRSGRPWLSTTVYKIIQRVGATA